MHFSALHFCSSEKGEKKKKKKEKEKRRNKGKMAFQQVGWQLLICSFQASEYVICYKKLI
jgi:hypothetical protein